MIFSISIILMLPSPFPRISLESLKCDINSLANKIFKLKQQINSTNDCSEYWRKASQEGDLNEKNNQDETSSTTMNHMFFEQMREFLSDAEKQIKQLTQKVETDLEQIRTQLGKLSSIHSPRTLEVLRNVLV